MTEIRPAGYLPDAIFMVSESMLLYLLQRKNVCEQETESYLKHRQ